MRQLLLKTGLPYAAGLAAAFFPVFAPMLPGGRALFASAAAGLAAAWLALRAAVLVHENAHLEEARRLGRKARLVGSTWNPLSWAAQGLEWSYVDEAGPPSDLRLDRFLICVQGTYANRLRFEDLNGRFPQVDRLALMALAVSYAALFSRFRSWMTSAAAAAGAAAACLWAAVRAQSAVQKVSEPETWERGPDGFGNAERCWPFWEHRHQRKFQRDPKKLRDDLRLVLRDAGGFGAGQKVLELGAGGGVLYEAAPRTWRKDWIQLDADPAALRYSRSWGFGGHSIRADARKLPFNDGSRDRVVGLTFFDAIFDGELDPVLDEVFRVLRPGGTVVHLQDFFDWPGPDLAIMMGDLLKEAGLQSPVAFDLKSRAVDFPDPGPGRAGLRAALVRMLAISSGLRQDRLSVLDELYAGGAGPGIVNARALFNELFRRALARHRFELLPPLPRLDKKLIYTTYVVARRP
jgi:SAM-dependent methyltransferase